MASKLGLSSASPGRPAAAAAGVVAPSAAGELAGDTAAASAMAGSGGTAALTGCSRRRRHSGTGAACAGGSGALLVPFAAPAAAHEKHGTRAVFQIGWASGRPCSQEIRQQAPSAHAATGLDCRYARER